jgi:hypothetical protein
LYLAAAARQHRKRPDVLRDLLVAVSIFVALVAGLNVLNRAMGAAMNNVTQEFSVHFEWAVPVNVVGLFAMAMADADGLWRYILFHPGGALLQFNYTYLCLIGLPGGLVLLWLLVRSSREEAVLVARYVFLTAFGSFVLVTTVYGARAYEARYVSAIGIMLIPIVFHSAHELWPRASMRIRVVLILTGVFYIAIPMAYGAAAVVAKVRRTPTYTTGPSHFYNPLLADTDARAVVNELTEGFVSSTDVWYLTEPISALDLPGRAIIRHADFLSPDELRRDRFCTNRPVRMRLLLPPSFEQNGKAQVIMDSFGEAQNWHRATVAGANYVLWTAELGVTERSEVIARGVLGRTPLRMLRIGVLLPHRTDSHEPGP